MDSEVFERIRDYLADQLDVEPEKITPDKTSKVIGHKSGVSAAFTLNNPTTGNVSGTIAVKGGKFNARTPQAIVWFNGKTQWTSSNGQR